jgi:hypothetical protein
MEKRPGRGLVVALALAVAPAFALAQTQGPGASGGTSGYEPGGVGPGGTAWSGSMPRQNVNMGRGGGPRSDGNGLGIDTQRGGGPGSNDGNANRGDGGRGANEGDRNDNGAGGETQAVPPGGVQADPIGGVTGGGAQ